MAKSGRKRSKPPKAGNPPATLANLRQHANRIRAKTDETIQQWKAIQDEIRRAQQSRRNDWD